jgi:hypothetical protein
LELSGTPLDMYLRNFGALGQMRSARVYFFVVYIVPLERIGQSLPKARCLNSATFFHFRAPQSHSKSQFCFYVIYRAQFDTQMFVNIDSKQ